MPLAPQNNIKRHTKKALFSLGVTLALAVGIVPQRQAIYDYARLYKYQPSASVASLATTTTMTPKARNSFYVNHPVVQNKAAFNSSCPNNGGEQTIVLGCYIPKQRGVYLYNVSDPQLNGVQQVTAAHEMLHSMYDRLNSKDRQAVDALLLNYYSHLQDQRLIDIFNAYKKSEPNDLTNEMHSIFGTEVAVLSPVLETYYKQYFTDRQKVTSYAAQYQQAFDSRKLKIAQYDQDLAALKAKIETAQASLVQQGESLKQQRQALNGLSNSDAATYNARVDQFNQAVQNYNRLVGQTKASIETYNNLVETRNAIAVETQNLTKELDSRVQTQSAQQ